MLCCAMAAFLLGFQVHEKSILLPLLPAALLALEEPGMLRVFGPLAAFSMFPLLRFERLGGAAYAVALCVGILVAAAPRDAALRGVGGAKGRGKLLAAAWAAAAAAGAAALHASYALPAPEALPHLHALAVSAWSAANFALVALYANVRQWQLPADAAAPKRRKAA
jgi:alpha-1,3-glucosyltransferase